MEEITEGVNNITINASDSHKKNRCQRYMQQCNEVELSALGMAIATVVTIAEILKNNGLAVEKKIMTSTVDIKDDSRGRPVQKAKEILYNFVFRLLQKSSTMANKVASMKGKEVVGNSASSDSIDLIGERFGAKRGQTSLARRWGNGKNIKNIL